MDRLSAWLADPRRMEKERRLALPGQREREEIAGTPPIRRQWAPALGVTALLLLVGGAGATVLGGPLAQFMVAGVQVIPFAILAFLAYLGVREMWARVLAFIWLGGILLGLAGLGLLLAFAMLIARTGALEPGGSPPALEEMLPPGGPAQLGAVALWSLLGIGVAALVLLPAVRRALARILPIDPRSIVHAIALSVVGGSTVIALGQLIAVGGAPPMLELVESMPEVGTNTSDADELLVMIYGFVWTVPAALVAGGFPVVRSLRDTLRRLGMVWPTWRQVVGGVAVGVLLVGGATLLDAAIGQVWGYFGWARTDSAAFERLLGAAISPIGAVVVGVTAGVGEEMVVRGVLQPRLGILLSNLFFTALHALQYGFDALLSVFVIGLILGIVRARSNTTTSSIVHGLYDFILVMITALGLFE